MSRKKNFMPASSLSQDKIDMIARCSSPERPLVIIPHDNPDVDAIVSAAMCDIVFDRLGISSVVCLRTDLDDITACIIEENNLMCPSIDSTITQIPPTSYLVLTDWFSVPDASNPVAAIFDHHPTSVELSALVIEEHKYNSTSKLLYDLFCEGNEIFDDIREELVRNVLFTVFTDTNSMKSTRFVEEDAPWIDKMIDKYGFDKDALIETGYCLNDLSAPVPELACNGAKRYVLPNGKIGYISYIITSCYDHTLDEALAREMRHILDEDNGDYAWHIICDLERDRTYIYKLSRSDVESDRNGIWESHDANLSRAANVYPMMEEENRV